MTEQEEKAYLQGQRAVHLHQLNHAITMLGYDFPEAQVATLISEREQIKTCIHNACRDYGDTDFPDNLNLVDVLEKHLLRHIE